MAAGDAPKTAEQAGEALPRHLLEPLRDALADLGEPQRYRLLAELMTTLATQAGTGDNGRAEADSAHLQQLGDRVRELSETKADLEDQLRGTQADLDHRTKQFEAEQTRAEDLQALADDQRKRLDELQSNFKDTETQLVARNSEVHKLEVDRDELRLQIQRLQMRSEDTSSVDSLAQERNDLVEEVESLKTELDELRMNKDAEIERLKDEARVARQQKSLGSDNILMTMWDRLASARPSLVQGGAQPTVEAGEKLLDVFIEFTRFVHELDQDMRVFLNKYTKHQQAISRQWQVFAARDDFLKIVEQTIQPVGGRNVGVLRLKLKAFRKFLMSAMVGCDSAMESIQSELIAQLKSPDFAGGDNNLKITKYIHNMGPELFMEHMFRLRSEKMAQVFAYGG